MPDDSTHQSTDTPARNRNRRPAREAPPPARKKQRKTRKPFHTAEGSKFSCDATGPCSFLQPFLNPDANGMTISEAMVLNIKQPVGKAAPRFIGYWLRRNRKDKGMILNFCPFCGADYRPLADRTGEVIPHRDAFTEETRLLAN